MTRRELMLGILVSSIPIKEKRSTLINDFEMILRKHQMGVPCRTSTRLLAEYLYETMETFSKFSEMRDREK